MQIKRVVIAGARYRSWNDYQDQDAKKVTALISELKNKYPEAYIVTVGADIGFGCTVMQCALKAGVGCIEITVRKHGLVSNAEVQLALLSRHAALMDLGEEFHIFTSKTRANQIEDLADRLRLSNKRYVIYDSENQIIEANV